MKKLTLQWRITLLMALIVAISTTSLTLLAILNASSSFMILLEPSANVTAKEMPLEAAITLDPLYTAKTQFDFYSILACIVMTLIGAVVAYFIAGKALTPLSDFSKAVSSIDETTLTERLPTVNPQDIIGILTSCFNAMLSRLEDAFIRQKRFTDNAAHELKTPLATMKTGIQVLEMDEEATLADYRDHAAKTLHAIDRLGNTVDDLLLSSTTAETVTHEKEPIWFEPLFETIVEDLSPLLSQHAMHCHIDCDESTILGNTALIYRAFSNLVENACKYEHHGGHIWLKAHRINQQIVVTVQDDGPGIAAEHLPYIFDAFYRVDKSRSRAIGGAGLGLSLVKTMIEANEGLICVASTPSGTCFTATFSC